MSKVLPFETDFKITNFIHKKDQLSNYFSRICKHYFKHNKYCGLNALSLILNSNKNYLFFNQLLLQKIHYHNCLNKYHAFICNQTES